jgi:hypothetical protein
VSRTSTFADSRLIRRSRHSETIQLVGLLGDRPGYRRLYFSRSLDYFTEFRTDNVLHTETVPPDQPPLVGVEAIRLTLRHDALIEFTRSRYGRQLDEFDVDVRLQLGIGISLL